MLSVAALVSGTMPEERDRLPKRFVCESETCVVGSS
jgi:hypothetical protein